MADLTKYKAILNARLAELDDRLHRIEHDLDEPHNPDLEDQAIEQEDDEVLERLGAASVKEVAAIRAALKRMDEGEYGVCGRCGGEISEERLDAVPTAVMCADCARTT